MRQTELHEVNPTELYAVAHQHGDAYSGPGGGYLFEAGVIGEPVQGNLLNRNGMPYVGVFFKYDPAKALRWDGCEWFYEEAKPAPPTVAEVVAPARPEKPKPKRGRPKGSKNKRR